MSLLRNRAVSVLLFILHQLFCPYVLVVLSAFLTFSAMPLVRVLGLPATVRTAHWVLTETPYYPVQTAVALIAGFTIGKCRRIRFTRWMWVLPLALLVGALIFEPLESGQRRLDHFFGWGGLPQFHQGDATVFTLPFYISVAYSLAGFLALRTDRRAVVAGMQVAN